MSAGGWLERVESRLDRLGYRLLEWWVWPAALVAFAAAVLLGSWAAVPGPEGSVAWFGRLPFPTCGTLAETGLPCAGCGTTRSFVWAARADPMRAFACNPSGLLLWTWVVSGGLVGLARLARRRADLLRVPWPALGGLAVGWLLVHVVGQQLRLAGTLPMP